MADPAVKLTKDELRFLEDVRCRRRPGVADRVADRMRQRLRKAGIVEVVMNPRRWQLTDKGRALLDALKEEGEGR